MLRREVHRALNVGHVQCHSALLHAIVDNSVDNSVDNPVDNCGDKIFGRWALDKNTKITAPLDVKDADEICRSFIAVEQIFNIFSEKWNVLYHQTPQKFGGDAVVAMYDAVSGIDDGARIG